MIILTNKQREAVNYFWNNRHCYFVLGTGVGKTFASLFSMQLTKDKTLVVVENKKMVKKWNEAIETLITENSFINIYKVVSYHELQSFKTVNEYTGLIFDECQALTTNSSKRSKRFKKLFNSKKWNSIIGLSATPIRHNEVDFWTMSKNLNMNIPLTQYFKNFAEFQTAYFKDGWIYGFNPLTRTTEYHLGKEFDESKVSQLYTLIPQIVRSQDSFTKKEFRVSFIKSEMGVYSTLLKSNIIEGHYQNFNKTRKLYALRMLSNSTFKLNGIENIIYDNDYKQKTEYIKKLGDSYNQIMVIYYYDSEREYLLEELPNSTTKDSEFKSGNAKYLLRQGQRSKGEDFYAQCLVFLSVNYSAEEFDQMKGRITRENADYDEVHYYYLIFENTIEPQVWDVMQGKLTKNELLKLI